MVAKKIKRLVSLKKIFIVLHNNPFSLQKYLAVLIAEC